MDTEARGYRRNSNLPFDPTESGTLLYWGKGQDRMILLSAIEKEVRSAGWRWRIDSGWSNWDLEVYGSRYVKVRLTTANEHHADNGVLIRVRVQSFMSKFCQCLFVACLILSGLLLLHVWPFSRTALLIPLVCWAMFLVNRQRVTNPVLGMIDEAAEKSGFWPVPAKKA